MRYETVITVAGEKNITTGSKNLNELNVDKVQNNHCLQSARGY